MNKILNTSLWHHKTLGWHITDNIPSDGKAQKACGKPIKFRVN